MDKNKLKNEEVQDLNDNTAVETAQSKEKTEKHDADPANDTFNADISDDTIAENEDVTDGVKDDITSFENMTVSELYALADSFDGENVIEDIGSEAFRLFAKGRSGDAARIYSEFLKLKKTFETPARGKSGQEKERAGYGFDRYAPSKDPSVGLTRRQMELARSSGMSFREYEELLGSVPSGRRFGTKF